MMDPRRLTGKNVEVKAAGMSYTGILVEIGLETVILKSPSGHREIPVEKIVSIAEAAPSASSLPPSPLRMGGR